MLVATITGVFLLANTALAIALPIRLRPTK
jgi:hypothetical protein